MDNTGNPSDISDIDLLAALDIQLEPEQHRTYSAREERIIAGFEDIQRFVAEHGRRPRHNNNDSENNDIFERLYAVRLDQLSHQQDCVELLKPLDHQGLLDPKNSQHQNSQATVDDDALLAALGLEAAADSLTTLTHVRSTTEKNADRQVAEEIANRIPCEDFEQLEPVFQQVQQELKNGTREAKRYVKATGFSQADITTGQFYILGGQIGYVASVGKTIKAPNGESDARLRFVYDNGTESNLLRRSLQRALYKDDAGRRITEPDAGPLFSDGVDVDDPTKDVASGTIYVLRSHSTHPMVVENREIIHKIGVTSGNVERRIANAKQDPTFLMADVEVVATYELYNINRTKLEQVIHRLFDKARLDIELIDRFGLPIKPKEWFLVPMFVIDDVVEKIRSGEILDYTYDANAAQLVKQH